MGPCLRLYELCYGYPDGNNNHINDVWNVDGIPLRIQVGLAIGHQGGVELVGMLRLSFGSTEVDL